MENNMKEIEVQLSYLKSDLKNVIAKKQALDKMKDKCYEWIDEINNVLDDVYKTKLEIKTKIGLLEFEMKEKEMKEKKIKEKESKWNNIPVLRSVEDINKLKLNKKERKIYIEAIKRATMIVDSNPKYYGEHAHIILDTVIYEMGYNPKDIKGY